MSKAEQLQALIQKIDEVIPSPIRRIATKIMLWLFIKGFRIKKYFKEAENKFVKFWYIILAIPLFLHGYILDVLINETVGKDQFGIHYERGTLSETIQRVVDAGPDAENYAFAVQVGTILNDHDANHIKGLANV